MIKVFFKYKIILAVLIILSVMVSALSATNDINKKTMTAYEVCYPTIIVDAGHGGFDGGAVASDGTEEKDINLAISMDVGKILSSLGFDVVYIRTTDTAVNTGGESTIRQKKRSDLMNRFATMKKYEGSIYLCIHQNKFSASSCNGAQIFYSPNDEGSKILAELIRLSVKQNLQPTNERQIKSCTKDVYIIHNATNTAVLIECGFLSNYNDLKNLKTEEYQQKMAFCIAGALVNYVTENES